MAGRLVATHGVTCRRVGERMGYFGWPSVARMNEARLVVVSSGLRTAHVCPWGKTVLHASTDDGRSWSQPRIINDSPIDDRDAGVVSLGGEELLVSWFTSDTREYFRPGTGELPEQEEAAWKAELEAWNDELVRKYLGSWVMRSEDAGLTWGAPVRVPVTAPHGPIRLAGGDLLYLGKQMETWEDKVAGDIQAVRSRDGGRKWQKLGTVPLADRTAPVNYHEPQAVELPSGRLIGAIRIEDHNGKKLTGAGIPTFSMMLTESDDGGRTWSQARPLGFHGSPPHLLRHSTGVLVLTYGYRQAPFGQRVALSHDGGASWDPGWILRDNGPDGDLGYPATVELADGSLFTVYYQKATAGEKCSLLWSRWHLP